jgi:hypothetical protein
MAIAGLCAHHLEARNNYTNLPPRRLNMKRIVIFPLFTLMMSTAALRAETAAATTCSNGTLNGAYGVNISGTRPAPTVLPNLLYFPGAIEQVIGVAIQIFDGQGNFSQTDNVKGSVSGITPNRPGSGTYSVNSDCTGTYTINIKGAPAPIVTHFVIVDSGAEFKGVVVSPQPVMVTANGRKMN